MTADAPARSPSTVAELLVGRSDDDGIGLIAGDDQWTWREVVERSRVVARWLAARRRPGPFHVGVLLDNTPDYLFTLFGAALAGAVVVGINNTRRGAELARDICHTDCQLVVTDAAHVGLLDGLELGDIPIVLVDDGRWLSDAPDPGDASEPSEVRGGPTADDLFVLIFTSGSTGAPKAVRMTHGRAAGMAAGSTWLGRDDVLYSAMPLFHGNALNAIVFPALAGGATIVLRPRFSASQFMPDIRRCRATFFSTVGRALSYVLATPESPDDRDNRVKFALAPESSPADMKAFRDRFGISCFAGYGSSENALIMTPVPGMPKDALGVPQKGTDAAVVDPETLEERPPARFDEAGRMLNPGDAIGELVGRNVVDRFEGYYNNPEADAERTRNGWYWSGDLGYRDGDGIFFFAGRSGEWLRVDAENFACAPVERILARFPPVRGAAVYAVPDERTADDQVMVALELGIGEQFDPQAFATFLDEQPDLGTKWAPRYVRVTTLPVGATNKVDKKPLKDQRWDTDDPIWWRPEPRGPYVPFTDDDRRALESRFLQHGRRVDRP
ncbi:MAG: AMP-binding protein [Acidimicrobiales bacterium]